MKHIKLSKCLSFLLLMSVFLQGCVSPLVAYRHPCPQSQSVWATDDGTVTFYIGEDKMDPVFGSVETDDGSVEISISMSPLVTFVEFYYGEDRRNWDNDNPPESFACGEGITISKNVYQIEITSADAIFESGQVLTFYSSTGDG